RNTAPPLEFSQRPANSYRHGRNPGTVVRTHERAGFHHHPSNSAPPSLELLGQPSSAARSTPSLELLSDSIPLAALSINRRMCPSRGDRLWTSWHLHLPWI